MGHSGQSVVRRRSDARAGPVRLVPVGTTLVRLLVGLVEGGEVMATVCYMSGDKLVEIEAPTEQEAERLARAELGEPEHKGGGTKYEDKMLNRTA